MQLLSLWTAWTALALAGAPQSGGTPLPTQEPTIDEILAEPESPESWSAAVQAALDAIARRIATGADLGQLTSPGLVVGNLRPAKLEVVFEGPEFVVRRPSVVEAGESETAESGDLPAAWRAWLGLEPSAEAVPHFKVIEIQGDGRRTEALLAVSAHGLRQGQRVEVHGHWESTWVRSEDPGSWRLADLRARSFEEVSRVGSSEPLFEEATEALLGALPAFQAQLRRGIDFWRDRIDSHLVIPRLAHPAGLVVGDVNGDGLEDLYLCQPGGLPNRLFLRTREGGLVDASASSGLDVLDFTRSALLLDFDRDGDRDFVLAVRKDLVFFENDGAGRFEPRASHPSPETTSLAAADYDGDGDLDLYACAYFGPYQGQVFPLPYHDANNGQRNLLLRNEGDWSFSDVTEEVGLEVNNRRFSFAASWEDYDDDGDPDLYVANDFGRNNLYRNDGGRFEDVAREAGVEDVAAGMGVSWGDFDGDGRFDLYVSNMFSSAGLRVTGQDGFQVGAAGSVRAEYRRHARGNSLFRNRGDGTFEDVSSSAGVSIGRWAWGSTICDLNGDGLEDLFVPNGFLTQKRPDDL